MSSHTSILKGCNAYFINRLVSRYNRDDEISNIYSDIRIKAVEVVNNYTIDDCQKVIIKYGDFHDAYVKLQSFDLPICVSNKLKFHRQMALIYVREVIKSKFEFKISHRNVVRHTCSICQSHITNNDVHISRCGHVFHRLCMMQFNNANCPQCNRILLI